MQGISRGRTNRLGRAALVVCVLSAAAAARLWFLTAGVPHALSIDEPQVFDRALRIMRTGDWNTHLFDYPSLVIYVHAVVAIGRFLVGALRGEWNSLATFAMADGLIAGRVAAACIGVTTVWFTYRLGREIDSTRVGLLGAAELAVRPLHVRESHFILTDVPVTACTTLALLLSARAARLRSAGAYAWAGAAAGLAAAAKYNGAVAFVAVAVAWAIHEWRSPARWRTALAACGGAMAAFLAGAPYTVLDFRSFIDGFAAQAARLSRPMGANIDPTWLIYVKHLSMSGRVWVPITLLGVAVVLWRRSARIRWAPSIAFAAAYFYVLATHSIVFARYALPLFPVVCLLTAAVASEAIDWSRRSAALDSRAGRAAVLATATLAMTLPFAVRTVDWLRQLRRPDTRGIAVDWLKAHVPATAGIAVENNGPTYLGAAGFTVLPTELLVDHPPEWYRGRAQYLVISSPDVDRYRGYLDAGAIVFQIAPTPQRWGPPIRIVKIGS